jgi:hypothetical protein
MPRYERGDRFLFGHPLVTSEGVPEMDRLEADLGALPGYFLFVACDRSRVVIAGDMIGGYRLYYVRVDEDIYFADKYDFLIKVLRNSGGLEPHLHEIVYWRRHGYTTGEATPIRGLCKLPPAGIAEITERGLTVRNYFTAPQSCPDARAHADLFEQEIRSVLASTLEAGKPSLLCFSGGSDSVLLAALLRDVGADFEPVFLRATPSLQTNLAESIRAARTAERLGLNLNIVDVPIELDAVRLHEIARDSLFDRHFSMLHFEGMRLLAQQYGSDRAVINGQTNDSILTFGPSGLTRGDLIARILMYRPYGWLAKAACAAVGRRFGRRFRAPASPDEYLLAFFDQHQYFTLLDDELDSSYRDYLKAMIARQTGSIDDWQARLMWLKLYGFIQGSDTQVVIRSARAAGFRDLLLPYAAPGLIYATVKHKDSKRELRRPKYVVQECLRRLQCELPDRSDAVITAPDRVAEGLQARLDACYEEELEYLLVGRV